MKDVNEVLQNLRVSYQARKLDIKDCLPSPQDQFDIWFKEAIHAKCDEPNAFVLSTVSGSRPRARVLLLKGIEEGKLIFYTNYKSAKGEEMNDNEFVAMTFLWLPLHRQVRVEGIVTKVSDELSDNYFQKRPRGSQLGAIASPQSEKIESREELENLFSSVEKKFLSLKILPRPKTWGGYAVLPTYFEFWQGRDNRMHDRICYEAKGNTWNRYRLAP